MQLFLIVSCLFKNYIASVNSLRLIRLTSLALLAPSVFSLFSHSKIVEVLSVTVAWSPSAKAFDRAP